MLQEWGKAHRESEATQPGLRGSGVLGSGQRHCWEQKHPMVCQEMESGLCLSEPHGQAGTGTLLHHGPGGSSLSASFGIASCVCLGGLPSWLGRVVSVWRVMVPFAKI